MESNGCGEALDGDGSRCCLWNPTIAHPKPLAYGAGILYHITTPGVASLGPVDHEGAKKIGRFATVNSQSRY